MKIQVIDEKIVLYLYNYFFKITPTYTLTKEIKKIFIRLIKNYHFKLGGIYNVLVYENPYYGTILEIEKIEELLFNPDLIDIKVRVINNQNFYFKTDDYFIIENYNNIYYQDGYYYLKLNDKTKITSLIEYGSIEYNLDKELKNMLLIK